MSDPKRDKPQDRKRADETKPDLPAAPLPSITAPKFAGGVAPPVPEVSVTSPAAPELEDHEPRTNTETTLDPAAYAAPADKDPDELSSDFAPASGKQLDAGGRLVAHSEPEPAPLAPARARGTPAPPPARAPRPPSDEESTDAAVPQLRPGPAPVPAARKVKPRSGDATEPPPPEPPVAQVSGQRAEPGRWILNREAEIAPENPGDVESGAFDPTVMRAAPSPPPRKAKKRPAAILVAVAAAAVVVAGGGAAWWLARSGPAEEEPSPGVPPPATGEPQEPARIRITSKPSGAAVHINGVSLGVTPVDRESPFAPEAEMEVEVLLKGYRPWTRRFHAGQSVSAHAQLKPVR